MKSDSLVDRQDRGRLDREGTIGPKGQTGQLMITKCGKIMLVKNIAQDKRIV